MVYESLPCQLMTVSEGAGKQPELFVLQDSYVLITSQVLCCNGLFRRRHEGQRCRNMSIYLCYAMYIKQSQRQSSSLVDSRQWLPLTEVERRSQGPILRSVVKV